MISKSPERYTFQAEQYVNRREEEGKEPNEDQLNFYQSGRQRDEDNMVDPEWQKDNMEYDLRSTEWILEKTRASDSYAQNLYAAMCNMQFIKLDVMPILKDQRWSCSWRSSGGIVADMREEGDYMDWYCSGIGGQNLEYDGTMTEKEWKAKTGYVPEGVVTDEIRNDLKKLGWAAVEWEDDE